MMSGLVSRQSISLYNEEDIRKIMKRFKLLIKLSELNIIWMAFCALLLVAIPIISKCSLGHIHFPGILWFLFFMHYGYHILNDLFLSKLWKKLNNELVDEQLFGHQYFDFRNTYSWIDFIILIKHSFCYFI
jgi:hypothetical protein